MGLAQILAAKAAAIGNRGYSAAKPWFHGTNKDVIFTDRPLWLAEDPMVASLYTGGGRRAGPGTAKSQGRLYPAVTRGTPKDVNMYATADIPPDSEWLRNFGIADPADFRKRVQSRAQLQAERSVPKSGSFSFIPEWDDLGYVGGRASIPGLLPVDRSTWAPRLWEVLDRKPFIDELVNELGPEVTFSMQHPSSVLRFGARGQVLRSPETVDASVLLAPRPEASLASPWDFKRGGLAQCHK